MIKFLNLLTEEKKKKKFSQSDRIKMYKDYYQNLSPKGFKIKVVKNKIVIDISE